MQQQLTSPALDTLAVKDTYSADHIAYLQVLPSTANRLQRNTSMLSMPQDEADWFVLCHRLMARVERASAQSALLDLGNCTPTEALVAIGSVVRALKALGYSARAGIAPGMLLAQLAAYTAPHDQPQRLLTMSAGLALLRDIPVAILPRLHPHGAVPPTVVARLERYGLRTVGHIARVDEPVLIRQFGAIGSLLALIVHGHDPRPLQPTPLSPTICLRVRSLDTMQPERALALAEHLSRYLAQALRVRGSCARMLRVQLQRNGGSIVRAATHLRQHTDDPALLLQRLHRLLASLLLPAENQRTARGGDGIEELHVTLGDLMRNCPNQEALWRTRDQRLSAVQLVADGLASRHGHSILFRSEMVRPTAVFDEERQRFAAIGSTNVPHNHALRTAEQQLTTNRAARSSDLWRDVPQRLHWC